MSIQGRQRRVLTLALLSVYALESTTARAQQDVPPVTDAQDALQLQREGNVLLLSATLRWILPDVVQDALGKGIPVHFIADAQLLQERWYWRDQTLLSAVRYMRLSYQPLTRRWRLYVGNKPFEGQGLGVALSSTFETIEEAVQSMQRIARWNIGPALGLPAQGDAVLQLRFRIDLSQFPRPLQIGALGRSDWNLLVTHREPIALGALQ